MADESRPTKAEERAIKILQFVHPEWSEEECRAHFKQDAEEVRRVVEQTIGKVN